MVVIEYVGKKTGKTGSEYHDFKFDPSSSPKRDEIRI